MAIPRRIHRNIFLLDCLRTVTAILLVYETLQTFWNTCRRRKTVKDFIWHIHGHSSSCIILFADSSLFVMSKKTIISDFSALKGKVTFSETSDMVESRKPQQTSPSVQKQPKAGENQLKVGQRVVLMDSNLRGHIVSLGKKVSIELEDGLIIEAAYGEFAVTDNTELETLKHSRIKQVRTSPGTPRSKQKSSSDLMEIDLHIEALAGGKSVPKGQQLQFQMDTFKRVIRENLSHRGLKISFIHGVGDGILKAAIRKELDEVLALRCTYSVGDPAVTIVTIR